LNATGLPSTNDMFGIEPRFQRFGCFVLTPGALPRAGMARTDGPVERSEVRRAIDLMQERRTALISAGVVGQIGVRSQGSNRQWIR
jgi:hypothetical protein